MPLLDLALPDELASFELPPPVLALAAELHAAGHEAFLVGGCVRDALRGQSVRDFDLATSATAEQVLALFVRAIATGIRHGTVTIPTEAGMVDVTTYRAGTSLAADLAHRDFTINAIALDPRTGAVIDPANGRDDLAAGRLRAVGGAADRLAEDPLRALRAARLVATLGLTPDAELEAALPGARDALGTLARERVRAELEVLLCGTWAAEGLSLLLRTGLVQRLAPGVRPDVPHVVAALPADLAIRLAALLRGTRAQAILAGLRFPRRTARRVALLLRHHPVEGGTDTSSDTSVRRLLQRAGEANVSALITLRRAELAASGSGGDAQARARIDALEAGLARVRAAGALALHRLDLAMDGAGVMQALGCRPGRVVGEALRFLTERVLEDPACNTPERLRALLAGWTPPAEPR
ncbi:MAG: CCA tRNA nucleotidyltransferase [Deltaproteobacteria bacterium]|nr:CCA tRNA nucleotidyltransferase [Deltaproteobacteria bacterium]